jgi:hypothetical protein
MRLPPIYIATCYAALSILIGCGGVVRQDSDGKGGVPVEAGDASMNPGGSGAANAGGSAGSMGNRAGARGAPDSANEYPSSVPVVACFGYCPTHECDNSGDPSKVPCVKVYPNPVDRNSTYCSGNPMSSYCLEVTEPGPTYYAVQCSGATTTIRRCKGCGITSLSPITYDCM